MVHRLTQEQLRDVSVPLETKQFLIARGVPSELVLEDWAGPTLFTSEIGGGRMCRLGEFECPIASQVQQRSWWVIGSIREPEFISCEIVHAAFCVDGGNGAIHLADLASVGKIRFVNSSIARFVESLELFVERWTDDDLGPLRERLRLLDAEAFSTEACYWPEWIDGLEEMG